MRKYEIQWAYALDIGRPVIHTNEARARGEVAHLLGTWIRRRLGDWLTKANSDPLFKRYPELEEAVQYLAPTLKRLMDEDLVWDAYDLWEDFYIQFENAPGYPLYVMLGTVIVRGSPETGLKNRVPLIKPLGMPPIEKYVEGPTIVINKTQELKDQMLMELVEVILQKAQLKSIKITQEQFEAAINSVDRRLIEKYPYMDEASEAQYIAELREGILRRLFPKSVGIGLGSLKRWHVQYADFGGAWHPGYHTNEERAKQDAKQYLTTLLHHLSVHADSEARSERNPEYVTEADHLAGQIQYWLDNDAVWAAYLEYKAFEERWNHHFYPFSLEMSIGSMRVIPEPEPDYK